MTALIILFLTALAVLFSGLFGNRNIIQPVGFVGVLLAFLASLFTYLNYGDPLGEVSMLSFGPSATAFSAMAIGSVLLLFGLVGFAFRDLNKTLGDQLGLILFSLCGALCLFSFTNLTMLFLGIEILSIPLYVLAGSRRDDLKSNEAALKYFLMGAFATGILLFGVALVYGSLGTFDLPKMAEILKSGAAVSKPMLFTGTTLMLVGMAFKVGAAPFHFWAPDVYEGSPSLVTAYMATVVKTAGFVAFYKLFAEGLGAANPKIGFAIAALAAMTIVLANATALFQNNFKRMMAYSSIAHTGYLLLALLGPSGSAATGAILLYTTAYSVATICAFSIFILVSEQSGSENFGAFEGLGKRNPLLAFVMAVSVLSLAGIPPTAGFFGKYFLFAQAFERFPWLIVLAVLGSAVSIYYYFRVIIAMYFEAPSRESVVVPSAYRVAMIVGLILIALLCVVPGSVLSLT